MKQDQGYDWTALVIFLAIIAAIVLLLSLNEDINWAAVAIFAGSAASIGWCVAVIVLLVKILRRMPAPQAAKQEAAAPEESAPDGLYKVKRDERGVIIGD